MTHSLIGLLGLAVSELEWWERVSTWLPASAWAWIATISFWGAWALVLLPGIFRWRKAAWHQGAATTGFTIFLLTLPALAGVHTRTKIGVILEENTPLRQTPTREAQILSRLNTGDMARYQSSRKQYIYIRTSGDEWGWIEKSQFGFLELTASRDEAAAKMQKPRMDTNKRE